MCMGNLAEGVIGGVGSILDVTGKLGIKDKFKDAGKSTRSKLSEVGQDAGFNVKAKTQTPALAPNQVSEVSAQQRRSSSLISK